jgi:outer membrane protein insertion porin family
MLSRKAKLLNLVRARLRQPAGRRLRLVAIRNGARLIRSETLAARIFTRPGNPYSQEGLQRDLRSLRNTQYFESILLEVDDDPVRTNAKIVIFHLTERPIIRRIEYRGLKSVTESNVLDRFKERRISLSVESPFDATEIKAAQVAIEDLLAEHGHKSAVVKATDETIPGTNAVSLVFTVDEGP